MQAITLHLGKLLFDSPVWGPEIKKWEPDILDKKLQQVGIGGPRNQWHRLTGEPEKLKTLDRVRGQVTEKERNWEDRITRVWTQGGHKSLEKGCKELGKPNDWRGGSLQSSRVLCNHWGRLCSWRQEPDWSGTWKVCKKDGLEVVLQIYSLDGTFVLLVSELSTILFMVLKNITSRIKMFFLNYMRVYWPYPFMYTSYVV